MNRNGLFYPATSHRQFLPGGTLKPVRPFRAAPGLSSDPDFRKWHRQYPRLLLDLGCGAGLNVIRTATARSGMGLIAIERTRNRFLALRNRLDHHHLPNVFAVNLDAQHWLPPNLSQPVVEHVYLLYPNPYPKERQANKRWHRHPLMHLLLTLLVPGGRIEVASNEAWFLEECAAYMTEFWGLEAESVSMLAPQAVARTHFEKKYLLQGQDCCNLLFRLPRTQGGDSA